MKKKCVLRAMIVMIVSLTITGLLLAMDDEGKKASRPRKPFKKVPSEPTLFHVNNPPPNPPPNLPPNISLKKSLSEDITLKNLKKLQKKGRDGFNGKLTKHFKPDECELDGEIVDTGVVKV